jgi:ubiquinone/menaquinone biosynthesis C-methylase UbiE
MSETTIDYAGIKTKQKGAWGTGNYGIIGSTLQIVGENLCEALDVQAGSKVLDVAAGNGNSTLAAAHRAADVTSTDYVPALLEQSKARVAAEGTLTPVKFQEADVEALPFGDNEFDVVLSSFGVMFSPNQEKAAQELLRVCKPGGKIGLANWTPEGFIGQLFKTIGKYIPPAAGLKSPSRWGSKGGLDELFSAGGSISATSKHYVFKYNNIGHWLEVFKTYYGPLNKAFGALDADKGAGLQKDITALMEGLNKGKNGICAVPSEYLEVVITKR